MDQKKLLSEEKPQFHERPAKSDGASVDPQLTISALISSVEQWSRAVCKPCNRVSATETDEVKLLRSFWPAGGQEDPIG
ncbi:hypothetical protein SRHO_G00183450 [Serrasalmus rhombeus]